MDRNAESTPPSPPDDAAHRAEPPRTSAIPGARAEIRFEEVDSVERLAAIRGPWTDLRQRAPGATPFSAPAWLLPWCRHLGERPPWAILAWRSRELAAVAPTFLYEERGVRVLALLGGGVSDYQDILAEDAAAATSLLEWLSHRRDRFDRADLRALRPGSPLLGCRVPEAFVGMPAADDVCPTLRLPASFDGLARGASRHLLEDVRRQRRRLARRRRPGHHPADADATARAQSRRRGQRGRCRSGSGHLGDR